MMADWDVIGTAPAQLQDPWAVRTLAPAPPATTTSAKGGKQSPVDQLLSQEVTQGPQGFLNGIAELVGKGMGNLPMAAVHGILDIASRASGHGAMSSASPTFPLSPNAQEVSTSLGNAAAPAAPIANAVANAAPVIGQIKQGMEAVEGTDFGKQYVAPVVGDVQNVAAMAPGVGAVGSKIAGGVEKALAPSAAAAAAAEAATPAAQLGLRTATNAPIARSIAGPSGREALLLANRPIGNTVAGAEAGVPHGTPVGYDSLEAAREAPNEVHARLAAGIPEAPLSPAAAQQVQNAGVDDLVTHTPDAQEILNAQKQRLLSSPLSGNTVINNMRALRQEGYARIASEDVEQQNLGKAQLDMSRALEQHVTDTLPPNSNVSMEQLKAARVALAKNYAVQGALQGSDVNLQSLARIQRSDPDLLTGNLKTLADFANEHPEVSSLPGTGVRYAPPGLGKDLGQINLLNPRSWVQPIAGSAARRSLTGNTAESFAKAQQAPVTGLGGEFNALPPGPLNLQPPAGRAFEPHQPQLATGAPQRDFFGTGADNFSASPPTTSPPTAAGLPGQIPLGDLLAHGVEQSPAPGLSAGPMGAPAPQGIPFQRNAAHEAGDLGLQLTNPIRGTPMNMSDFPGVMSQGVPEGIVQKFPNRGGSDQGSIGAVSPESINRGSRDLAVIDPDGNEQTLLKGATQIDDLNKTPKDSIVIDRSTGEIVHRPASMSQNIANGLRNRWATMGRQLGDNFVMGAR